MPRKITAVSALAGAVLLGAAFGATTPTAMLDKDAVDWRSTLPQHGTGLAYVQVGSAPESPEFGRRPLDAALLAGASYSGDTLVLSEAADVELLGDAGPRRAPPEPDAGLAPPAAAVLAEAAPAVEVHYGTPPAPASAPSEPRPEAPVEPGPAPAPPELAAAL